MWILSKASLEHREDVDDKLIQICDLALEISKVDFGIPIHGGLRTADVQRTLYNDGKSERDGFVKKSHHQSGRALDFYAYVDGKASWDKYHLHQVACGFLQAASELGYGLQWGGHFKSFIDMPHVQLV